MTKYFARSVYFLLLSIIGLLSCNKAPILRGPDEYRATAKKGPIASAGDDQSITLPTDSVVLDGSGSSDCDGNISNYWWNKIAGPSSYVFIDSLSAKTVVKELTEGTYMFELIVQDDWRLKATDVVEIAVGHQ